jgi:hypothetical protein
MTAVLLRWGARLLGAGMLGATAGIHLALYEQGYRSIHTIGPLFLLAGVMGSVLCLAIIATPRRALAIAAAGGAAFEVGILLGLLVSTKRTGGLFGFQESTRATYYWQAVTVEAIGAVVLAALAGSLVNRRSSVAVRGV